ncbi:3'(2'),5'-bisphosphate nucleotidase CysQ family protein [Carboxylicivirga sp. N1Y90]|uniref:3'(2'),5'-bisphosphate nucleotidase CysQ family protein n=1 Tax=Carboxylicivirga fragile TaxID=3417571 RepID=UPI003D332A3D|nr:inositol monophosphatase family protein [Marinilabiliaceae bacterium N1Y90]
MELSNTVLEHLADMAAIVAKEVGVYIKSQQYKLIGVQSKLGGDSIASQVFTEVDLESQRLIVEALLSSIKQYDLGLLAEESSDDNSRLVKDYFWCIDPLDGTLLFTEGKEGFAVSIALLSQAGIPQLGIVCDPVNQISYKAIKGIGVWRNGISWTPEKTGDNSGPLRLFCDRSFLKHTNYAKSMLLLDDFACKNGMTGVEVHSQAGAVMNAIAVLENKNACYFKFPKKQNGGGSIWDYAATACIFKELGFWVSNIRGEELELNNVESTFMNHQGVVFSKNMDLAMCIVSMDYK